MADVIPLFGHEVRPPAAVPCGFLTTTPEGLITDVNDLLVELTGRSAQELAGRAMFVDLLSAGGQIFHETQFSSMLQSVGQAREVAFDLVRPDGTTVPVLVNAVLDRDGYGVPRGVRMAVFEATNRRTYERALLAARRQAQTSERRAVSLARTLQQILIPPAPPSVPGLEVGAAYRPAGRGDEVGGDFYDVFELEPGRWAVAIGDVCGKGVEAAVVTSLVRHTLRAASVGMQRPSEALGMLNDVLNRGDTDRFCTVALVLLEEGTDGWSATISSAGHPLPQLVRPGARPRAVGVPGSLLGVLPDIELVDVVVDLAPGDALVLYTDGITEGRGSGEFYGEARLREVLARLPHEAPALAAALLRESMAFQYGDPRDDIAVVAVSLPVA